VGVLVRRTDGNDHGAQERESLAAQRAALEDLKRELGERVAAVKQREDELRAALGRVASGKEPGIALPPQAGPDAERLAMRAASLLERERAVAARESALAGQVGAANGDGALAAMTADLEARSRTLETRVAALDAREHAIAKREQIPELARLAEIDARLATLRDAEEAFLRTRRELADRSDALAARERMIAQRERELDERDDGWGGPEMHELEARLRRLERHGAPGEGSRSFSGGFRRLEQQGTRRPPGR
jgi:hypothetical protein